MASLRKGLVFKKNWVLGIVVFDAIVIVSLTIYLFFNFSKIRLAEGIVLLAVAGIIMLSIIGLMVYLTRRLAVKKNSENHPLKNI